MSAFALDRLRKPSARSGDRIIPLAVEPLVRSSKASRVLPPIRPLIADLSYFALRLAGWLSLTVLATLGLYVLFFMALGAFTAEGFFAHLANLATRYGEAEPARQALFVRQVAVTALVVFIAVSAARYRSFAAVFAAVPDPRKD